MMRNPIYQALRTTGLIQRLEDAARRSGAHASLYAIVRQERAALRSMREREVIEYDEYVELRSRVSRALHARLLRDYRAKSHPRARRDLTRTVRRICPPGTSRYAFRTGRRALA